MSFRRAPLPIRWKVFGTLVLALLAGSLWLRYRAGPQPVALSPAPPPYSVAVRRFLNVGPDTATDALGAVFADDVALVLGRAAGLRLADGASVRAAARASGDPGEIGRRLGVGSVLEGTFRLAGDRVRVTVHLVSVDRGFDLWSETFEQTALDLLAVRDSIARGIIATLRPEARGRPARGTSGPAYLAYLHGREALAAGEEAREAAAAAFSEAIQLDSSYAPAWAGLAEAYLDELQAGVRAPSESGALAGEAADRALALDSLDLRALVVRGAVRYLYERDWSGARADFGRAAALDSSRTAALHWTAHVQVSAGLLDSALAASSAAIARSPLDPALRVHLAWHHAMVRQDTLARMALARAGMGHEIEDGHAALLAELSSDTAAAATRLSAVVAEAAGRVDLLAELARLEALSGRADEARQVLARLRALADARYVSPYQLAVVHAALGEVRPAIAALARALDERDPAVVDLPRDPRLDVLRGEAGFAALARRIASAAAAPPPPARTPERAPRSSS